MNRIKLVQSIVVISIICFSLTAYAGRKKRVAVLHFKPNKVTANIASAVRDLCEVYLFKTRAFDVIERNQVDLILKEQGFAASGCVDTSCAVKIGKMLSVDMVVIGSIMRLDDFMVTMRFIDVEKSTMLFAENKSGKKEKDLAGLVKVLSKKAALHFTGREQDAAPVHISADYYFRGIIPGWAQFYSGNTTKGYLFSGGFIVSGSFMAWAYYNYKNKQKAYNDLGVESKEVYDKKYDEYKTATTLGRVSLGIFAAVYVINWLDVILFPGFKDQAITKKYTQQKYFFSFDTFHYEYDPVITAGYGMRF